MSFYQHRELAAEDLAKARGATKGGPVTQSDRQEADQRKRTRHPLSVSLLCARDTGNRVRKRKWDRGLSNCLLLRRIRTWHKH